MREFGITVDGYEGTWRVERESTYDGEKIFLVVNEQDELADKLIINDSYEVIIDGVEDFSDLPDWYDITMLGASEMWSILEDEIGVSRETLDVVTSINGYNEDTMNDILYAVTGYRNFEQAQEEFGYDLRAYC